MKSIKNYLLFTIGLLCLTQTQIHCAAKSQSEVVEYETVLSDPSINELITIAQSLHDTYPPEKYIVYGVGNSPAFLIKTLKMFYPEEKDRFKHLRFSGGWWYQIEGQGRKLFKVKEKGERRLTPHQDEIKAYFDYLSEAISLEECIAQHKKIVFIDLVVSGAGMRSFAEIMNNWIVEIYKEQEAKKEEALASLHFHCFKEGLPEPCPWLRQARQTPSYLYFPEWETLSFTEEPLPDAIRACGEIDKGNERLVPKFPFTEWGKMDPNSFIIHEDAKRTLVRIAQEIKKQIRQ